MASYLSTLFGSDEGAGDDGGTPQQPQMLDEAGTAADSGATGDDGSSMSGSDQAQHAELALDPSIDISLGVGIEMGGSYDYGDTSGTWSREVDLGADVSTDAALHAILDHGSSSYDAEG